MQTAIIGGNITSDARVNKVDDKRSAVSFTIATSRRYRDDKGEQQETKTQYHDCSVYRTHEAAEALRGHLHKGRHVLIEGRVQTGKPRAHSKDGVEKKYVNKNIVADEILEFGPRKDGQAAE